MPTNITTSSHCDIRYWGSLMYHYLDIFIGHKTNHNFKGNPLKHLGSGDKLLRCQPLPPWWSVQAFQCVRRCWPHPGICGDSFYRALMVQIVKTKTGRGRVIVRQIHWSWKRRAGRLRYQKTKDITVSPCMEKSFCKQIFSAGKL